MKTEIRVEPEHFEYLRIQKGSLDEYAHDFPDWHRRYQDTLRETFDQVAPWLPEQCANMLDVGSGLGGIDVLLARHYHAHAQDPVVSLLDGIDDPPVMVLHRRTFNSMRVARDFQTKNGLNPQRFASYDADPHADDFEAQFDLVVSFGSWCFHYPPSLYLKQVYRACVRGGTILCIDVRRHKLEWMRQLEQVFDLVTMVHLKTKWSRCVFRVKP